MDLVLLAARLVLAAVFALAGVAKLADRDGSRRAMEGFGVPTRMSGVVAVILPVAELAVAIALVSTSFAWWGALSALGLLTAFVVGVVVNLSRGRHPDCRCFGQLHAAPVGRSTLIRNVVLAAVAGYVVWQGRLDAGASVADWLFWPATSETGARIILVIVALFLALVGWLEIEVLRQHGRLLLRVEELEKRLDASTGASSNVDETHQNVAERRQAGTILGLPVGSVAPEFELADLNGELQSLADLLAHDKPVMLLFTDPSCSPCTSLLPEIDQWQHLYADRFLVVLVAAGARRQNAEKLAAYRIEQVLVQERREVAEAYRYAGTPSAVIVSPAGRIASPLAAGVEAIRSLVRQEVAGRDLLPLLPSQSRYVGEANDDFRNGGQEQSRRLLRIGDHAHDFALLDLAGKTVDLASLRGRETVLVFWNPACGFCQRMLPDLVAWERQKPPAAPSLAIVSTGSREVNRTLGLRSPVLIDRHGQIMATFGANGTPMAVLLDANGDISSDLAVGRDAVLDLVVNGTASSSSVLKPAAASLTQ